MKTIALVGNPNSGKTTVFNSLTGSNQHVGNWPGVTVEKKEGKFKYKNTEYIVVDLPGTYGLGAYSEDEIVARDFLLKGNPDIVINVVDATNIERNLYLTTQLMGMGVDVIISLNMMDEVKQKNIEIDIKKLSKKLGISVIPTIAHKEKGLDDLIEKTVQVIERNEITYTEFNYGEKLENEITKIEHTLSEVDLEYPKRWVAIKLLEGDPEIKNLKQLKNLKSLKEKLFFYEDKSLAYELEIVDKRYSFIGEVLKDTLVRPEEETETITDKIDKVLTHKYFGIPIFALIMFTIFQLTFKFGEDFLGSYMVNLVDFLSDKALVGLTYLGASPWIKDFFLNALFEGVGAVLEFIPLIAVLYFFLGILEDTGYMARAAYVMDSLMRKLGLQGKTFISMIVGFGCNVPGIMATRTLENKKDRMIALLINPFMSCGAKIPIYTIFIAAFFPNYGGIALFTLYFLGIIVALVMGKIFSKTIFKGQTSHFIMELPPYRLPTLKYVLRDMWTKVRDFVIRAGTIIFAVVSLLWVLARLPLGVDPYSQTSILGKIGTFISPIFKPAGFGTWQSSVGLFAGIAAKEAVVATLGMVYAGVTEGTALVEAISGSFTTLSAAAFLVMTLLYTPCAAVIATVKRETNSYKWAIFMVVYPFLIGWGFAVLIYQVGSLFGLG
ncbi:MAG: ferrous iron transport protein B [Clostridium sp.]|nr:ferrous iron transport protein B [Clostridium sp.]